MKIRRRDFLGGSIAVGAAGVLGVLGGPRLASASDHDDATAAQGAITPVDLRCEYLRTPLGIDAALPRLSWRLASTVAAARNQKQSAYQILVAGDAASLAANRGDLWDSGKIESGDQLHIAYQGRPLASAERCHWKVRTWDADVRPTPFSQPSWWEMGLLVPADWAGQWIDDGKPVPERDEDFYRDDPAPLLRKTFDVRPGVRRARLYAAGLGYYELRFNGEKVSDHLLDPAWTNYTKRVLYTTHDVTSLLRNGPNALAALLGNGWFNPLPLRMWGRINVRDHLTVGRPRLIAQLNIEYEDGTTQSVASDEGWRVAAGPIMRNSVYLGEVYDARREQPGWDQPGFDDRGWANASPAAGTPLSPLHAQAVPPIRATATLRPASVTEVQPGVFIFDMGQNFAGWARLRVEGPRGTTVTMRMGELLHPDGTLNVMTTVAGQIKGANRDGTPRGGPGAPDVAWQSNEYTLRGSGPEVYTPRFTFHGFRYVEVTGFPGTPTLEAIEGLRLNTAVESSGTFTCSNDLINRIQTMVQWTLLSNLFSVQSDCPAREKFQYGGDIVASSDMAILNYDMSSFYAKTVQDHQDAARDPGWFTETAPFVGISAASYEAGAGPIGWGLAHPLLVVQLYQYYGNERLVQEHYEAARRWVGLLTDNADGYIVDRCISDHESIDPKPVALMATAHFFQAAQLIERLARVLGRTQEAEQHAALAGRIREAFISRFLSPGTGRFDTGTQACQATALYMGLVPDAERDAAIGAMVDRVLVDHNGHIATGIFGTKYLLDSLTETGHADVAYAMVTQETFPGWGHMLAEGATTLWEHWEYSDNTYSHNHPMFGSVSEWFFKGLGGIKPHQEAVGFNRILIEPHVVGDLTWTRARYDSARGPIVSNWRIDADRLTLDVEIPVNTTAVVRVPTQDPSSVTEGGRLTSAAPGVTALPTDRLGGARFEVGSGRYVFEAAAPRPRHSAGSRRSQ
ncbi:MAG: family 78 glycoside hydrolase catalytic domain [Acidobacteria bacterium]|nr:family 78 glycoside hydrolase catalytic domain [Acidobacteriota bacterium]